MFVMARIEKLPGVYRVDMTEYERGWGQKLDETLYFDNEAEARQYAIDYNLKHNDEDIVPDWYIRADYVGKVV
jgi:hypothetical protein